MVDGILVVDVVKHGIIIDVWKAWKAHSCVCVSVQCAEMKCVICDLINTPISMYLSSVVM